MAEKAKKSRIMKVTMDDDEFEKLDRGETHSDKGVRNSDGSLSALPDIEEISEDDLPTREVVRTEIVYEDRYIEPAEPTGAEIIGNALGDIIVGVITDPEVQEMAGRLFKAFFEYKVKPRITRKINQWKAVFTEEPKATKIVKAQSQKQPPKPKAEVTPDRSEKIEITKEQADLMIKAFRQEAKKLTAMIYVLSNITVKDSLTNEEYQIEQEYLKELISDESRHTMQALIDNKRFLEDETVICLSDFLDGYLRNGDLRIPVPALAKEE